MQFIITLVSFVVLYWDAIGKVNGETKGSVIQQEYVLNIPVFKKQHQVLDLVFAAGVRSAVVP